MTQGQKNSSLIAVSLIVLGCVIWFFVGRGYGETSEQGYAYSLALFTACNQKSTEKLDQISEMIAKDVAAGDISEREAKWLNNIISDGRQGDWQAANRAVRQLMNDQVQPTGAN